MSINTSLIDIVNDRLNLKDDFLPAFDSNAFKIQQEASKKSPDIQVIEKLIVQDQALTSQVLKLANSAFYKGLNKVTTVKNAIMRLGTKEVANIALMVSQKSGYKSKDPYYQKIMDNLWRHSVACAVGSHWICKNGQFDDLAQEAFFAGLLHDIGKLLVMAVIADVKSSGIIDINPPEAFLNDVMKTLHADKGYTLMTAWNLPEKYAIVVRDHHAEFYDTGNYLLTIVRLANITCNKIGIGDSSDPNIVLTATAEAETLGLSEIKLAQLEIKLEDTMALSKP